MFHCPYYNFNTSLYRETPSSSFIRVFHASPNAPAVDIYVNDKLTVKNLPYKNFSNYIRVPSGKYNVKVYPTGRRDTAVINTNVDIPARTILTAAAVGSLPNLSLLPVIEPVFNRVPGKTYVRFAHLSPNAPNVDVTSGGNKVFTNVPFKGVTDYIQVNPGVYNFDVNVSESGDRVLYVPNIRLLPNRIYTIYAVGLAGKNPPLQVLIPLDGNSYLKV
jgi:hypothetical protein